MSGNYKLYGKAYIDDDKFLTLIGSLSSIANGGTRTFWCIFMEKISFKGIFAINLGIEIILFGTMQYAPKDPVWYLFWVFI